MPPILFGATMEQLTRIKRLDEDLLTIEKRLTSWKKQEPACKAIAEIPGIGLLTATALVATVGNAGAFRSGREFAAFVGLVPRQSGTGGKIRLGRISKRGDPHQRTLLIHGARAVLFASKQKNEWVESLLKRRSINVTAVALANKIAGTAWAILAHGSKYDRNHARVATA